MYVMYYIQNNFVIVTFIFSMKAKHIRFNIATFGKQCLDTLQFAMFKLRTGDLRIIQM